VRGAVEAGERPNSAARLVERLHGVERAKDADGLAGMDDLEADVRDSRIVEHERADGVAVDREPLVTVRRPRSELCAPHGKFGDVEPHGFRVWHNPRIEFPINLKVARWPALDIPPAVPSRADRLIR